VATHRAGELRFDGRMGRVYVFENYAPGIVYSLKKNIYPWPNFFPNYRA
jgi:hypothetical protein